MPQEGVVVGDADISAARTYEVHRPLREGLRREREGMVSFPSRLL